MRDSLFQFYSLSPLNLYEVSRHFLWHFYCQNHSRKDAGKVLRAVVASSKIGRIIEKSIQSKSVPNYSDFLSAIKGMFKFLFCSKDTLILATIEAVLRWDIVANSKLNLRTPEELKQDTLKVLRKYLMYREVPTEDNFPIIETATPPVLTSTPVNIPSEDEHIDNTLESDENTTLKTWTLDEFTNEFGPKMQVK